MLDFICHGDAACIPELRIGAVLCCAWLAIVFVQSGFDKVFDWSGNVGWLTDHFADTPFAGQVPLMVGIITLFELASGGVAAAGGAMLLVSGAKTVAQIGFVLSGITFLQLFFGQRIAKDYPGAAVLVPYFLVVLAGLGFLAAS
jgi:hypothetical protein